MAATLIGLSGMVSRAQTDEEVSALLAEALLYPDWERLFTATTGIGQTDNVYLSNADPQSSPFVSASGEVFLLRLAPTGPRITIFGNAEARYYFAKAVRYAEYNSFNQISLEGDLTDWMQGSIAGRYFYQDEVLDVSATETNRQATPVLGHTFSVEPGLRLELPGQNWIGLTAPATRQFFDEPLDSYWEVGGALTLGHAYRWDSQVTLLYAPQWRPYDSDPARTSTGTAIPGTTREAFQQDARLTWRHHWDEEKHWRTVFTLGGRMNTENGGGYSDYVRGLISGRVQYRSGAWTASAEGRVAHYNYLNQTVSATDLDKRKRTELDFLLDLERRLSDSMAWRLSYAHESVLSNDPLETYDVNTLGTSLSLEF